MARWSGQRHQQEVRKRRRPDLRRPARSRRIAGGERRGVAALSRDARYAALWQWTRYGPAELRILDLETGRTRIRLSDPNGAADTGSLLWLPGDRLVGILDGRLFVYDAENGNVSKPDLQLDDIQQLRLRTVS
jgi:hypothetical protein